MKDLRRYLFVLISVLIWISASLAEEILFSIEPGNIPYLKEGRVYASWQLKGGGSPPEGINIYFFGKAEGCNVDTQKGSVETYEGRGKFCYRPIPDSKSCDLNTKSSTLCSFVCFDEGIKIRTGSGLDSSGVPCFLNARDKEGIGGGINAHNIGNFVNFNLSDEKIKIFNKHKRIRISFQSSVEVVSLSFIPREKPVQAHQKVTVGLQNKHCIQERKDKKNLCSVKFLFVHFVKRISVKPHKFEKVRVWFDRGQGGMPIISVFSDSDLVGFCGDSLKHEPFKDVNFCYEISWEQFLKVLGIVVAEYYKKPIESVSEVDLISVFGSKYNDPSTWYLKVVSFSHEIHDPYRDYNNYIEGELTKLTIRGKE